MVPSASPVANFWPSGLKAALDSPVPALMLESLVDWRVSTSQRMILPSAHTDVTVRPSGL